MSDWKSRIALKEGESLKHEASRSKGFMQETDIDEYSIVDARGAVTGKVTVTDHTAVRGFQRNVHVVQKDATGKVIVDESWLA